YALAVTVNDGNEFKLVLMEFNVEINSPSDNLLTMLSATILLIATSILTQIANSLSHWLNERYKITIPL
ncbi:hypothetical protein, partial [Paenibacillus ferrarius]|uniref:hypothetical protein n=1 Tax=Paenibacillus ferrarius TaxID=1469647 RepID=UPI003D2BD6FB